MNPVAADLESLKSKELEGKLLRHLYLIKITPTYYWMGIDYYAVLNGIVYSLRDDKMDPSGDSCWETFRKCEVIGEYDPGKTYKSQTKEFSSKAIMNYLGMKDLIEQKEGEKINES